MKYQIDDFIERKYIEIGKYTNGMSIVKSYTGKYGAIDINGKLVVDCVFEEIKPFNKYGLAIAKMSGKGWGVINTQGDTIIPFKYDSIESYNSDIYFKGKKSGDLVYKYICPIFSGKYGTRTKYIEDKELGSAIILKNGMSICDVFSTDGRKLDHQFWHFSQKDNIYYGKVADNIGTQGGYVFYDKDLNKINDKFYSEEMIIVKNNLILKDENGDYSVINTITGDCITAKGAKKYSIIKDKSIILYITNDDKKSSMLIEQDGKVNVFPDIHVKYVDPFGNDNELLMVQTLDEDNNQQFGVYTKSGKVIIPCEYARIKQDDNYYIVTDKFGKKGCYDLEGTLIFDCEYDSIEILGDNRFLVTIGNNNMMIDKQAKEIADLNDYGCIINGNLIEAENKEELLIKKREALEETKKALYKEQQETAESLIRINEEISELESEVFGTNIMHN